MEKKRLGWTITLGVLSLLSLGLIIFLYCFDVVGWASSDSSSSASSFGEALGNGIDAGVTGAFYSLIAFFLIAICLFISIFGILFSIRNRKSPAKRIRNLNLVYCFYFAILAVLAIIRLILLLCGLY
ncbi:MAG: hypothetical protein Q4F15_05280 [Bacillota bacterium]|nr:hypothetical protein [Bacillota bacterium]